MLENPIFQIIAITGAAILLTILIAALIRRYMNYRRCLNMVFLKISAIQLVIGKYEAGLDQARTKIQLLIAEFTIDSGVEITRSFAKVFNLGVSISVVWAFIES